MIVKRLLQDRFGQIMLSVILGIGLAALFRRACSGDGCFVIKAPSARDINDYVYKVDKACYKYTPNVVPCAYKPPTGAAAAVAGAAAPEDVDGEPAAVLGSPVASR